MDGASNSLLLDVIQLLRPEGNDITARGLYQFYRELGYHSVTEAQCADALDNLNARLRPPAKYSSATFRATSPLPSIPLNAPTDNNPSVPSLQVSSGPSPNIDTLSPLSPTSPSPDTPQTSPLDTTSSTVSNTTAPGAPIVAPEVYRRRRVDRVNVRTLTEVLRTAQGDSMRHMFPTHVQQPTFTSADAVLTSSPTTLADTRSLSASPVQAQRRASTVAAAPPLPLGVATFPRMTVYDVAASVTDCLASYQRHQETEGEAGKVADAFRKTLESKKGFSQNRSGTVEQSENDEDQHTRVYSRRASALARARKTSGKKPQYGNSRLWSELDACISTLGSGLFNATELDVLAVLCDTAHATTYSLPESEHSEDFLKFLSPEIHTLAKRLLTATPLPEEQDPDGKLWAAILGKKTISLSSAGSSGSSRSTASGGSAPPTTAQAAAADTPFTPTTNSPPEDRLVGDPSLSPLPDADPTHSAKSPATDPEGVSVPARTGTAVHQRTVSFDMPPSSLPAPSTPIHPGHGAAASGPAAGEDMKALRRASVLSGAGASALTDVTPTLSQREVSNRVPRSRAGTIFSPSSSMPVFDRIGTHTGVSFSTIGVFDDDQPKDNDMDDILFSGLGRYPIQK